VTNQSGGRRSSLHGRSAAEERGTPCFSTSIRHAANHPRASNGSVRRVTSTKKEIVMYSERERIPTLSQPLQPRIRVTVWYPRSPKESRSDECCQASEALSDEAATSPIFLEELEPNVVQGGAPEGGRGEDSIKRHGTTASNIVLRDEEARASSRAPTSRAS